jgi:hypothetical protein
MRDRVAREVQSQRRVIIEESRVRVTPLWDAPAGNESAEAGQWLDREQWRQVGGESPSWPPCLLRYHLRALSIPEPARVVLADLDLSASLVWPHQWARQVARVPVFGRVEIHPDTEVALREMVGRWADQELERRARLRWSGCGEPAESLAWAAAGAGPLAAGPGAPEAELFACPDVPRGRVRFAGGYRDAGRVMTVGSLVVRVQEDQVVVVGH